MNLSSMHFLFLFLFLSFIAPYSIFYKSSFTLKLDFLKIEFQNMGISLIRLGKGAKRWFFFWHKKGHFSILAFF